MPFTASSEKIAQRFRYLFDEAALGIAVEDIEGKVLHANRALCSILGYRQEELCGMTCSQFANPHDSQDNWTLFQKLREGEIDRYSIEKHYVRKDGVPVWGRLSVSLLKGSDGAEPLVFAFVEDITERKQAEEALAQVSRRLIEAQEQERKRIGRELHDDIGQRLALLAAEIQQMETPSTSVTEAGNRLDELWKRVSEIANDVQALSHELHSSRLEYLGIVAAIRAFCKEFGEKHRIEIEFTTHDLPIPLPSAEISLCLFRVLQEAVHNAAKYSGVRHFEVELWGQASEIHLRVSDFGAGFEAPAAHEGRGLGLTSMRERLKAVNGQLLIKSQPKHGTTIHARVTLGFLSNTERAAG